MNEHQEFTNDFNRPGKNTKDAWIILRVWTEKRRNLWMISKKIAIFLIITSFGNYLFYNSFLHLCWSSACYPKLYNSAHGRSQNYLGGWGVFKKIFKKYSKNLFQKILTIFKKFQKFSNIFRRKLLKCLMLAYFSKNWTNPAFQFCAFRRKTLFSGNSEKPFEDFQIFS